MGAVEVYATFGPSLLWKAVLTYIQLFEDIYIQMISLPTWPIGDLDTHDIDGMQRHT